MLTVEPSKRSNYFYGFTYRFQIRRLILYVIKRLIRANNTFKRYKFLQFTRIWAYGYDYTLCSILHFTLLQRSDLLRSET